MNVRPDYKSSARFAMSRIEATRHILRNAPVSIDEATSVAVEAATVGDNGVLAYDGEAIRVIVGYTPDAGYWVEIHTWE